MKEIDKINIKNRIKKIRNDLNLSQTKFAEQLAVSRSAICKMESGENFPSEQTIKLICKEFNISYLWLTEGIGEMNAQLDSAYMTRIDALMTGENEFAKNLFKEFAKLDKSEWELLEKIIKNISKQL